MSLYEGMSDMICLTVGHIIRFNCVKFVMMCGDSEIKW